MLRLEKSALDDMRRHAESTYPQECCGVLLGVMAREIREVHSTVRCGNASTEPHNRYSIDPVELIRIQRDARPRGLEIVGFYHSHPDHPATWSATDFAEAHWIGCSYVIVSVESAAAGVTASFFLGGTCEEDKAFLSEELVVA